MESSILKKFNERYNEKIQAYKKLLENEKNRKTVEMLISNIFADILENVYEESLVLEARTLSELFKENNYDRSIIDLFDLMSDVARKKYLRKPCNNPHINDLVLSSSNELSLSISNDVIALSEMSSKGIDVSNLILFKPPKPGSNFSIYRDIEKKLEYVIFQNRKYQVNEYDDFWKEDIEI